MAVTPGQVNFLCPQGSTFSKTITYSIDNVPVDLSGYSARLQVRPTHYSEEIITDLSSSNGITMGASAGTIDLFIAAQETEQFPAGNFVYDLELESSGGIVSRIIEGTFIVTPEVTR
jgi:hypothetical protein